MKLIKIGKVLKPHGFRGSFTVSSTGAKDSVLKTVSTLYIGTDEKSARPFKVSDSAWMPKAWKITVEEVTSDEQVNLLREQSVFVVQDSLPKPRTGEYYVSDLIGLEGIDSETRKSIGNFSELQELAISNRTIVQHTWIFKNAQGQELQVPAVPHFIVAVDLVNKKIFLKNLKELESE